MSRKTIGMFPMKIQHRFHGLGFLACLMPAVLALTCKAQVESSSAARPDTAQIEDRAKLLSRETVSEVETILQRLEKDYAFTTVILTNEAFEGLSIEETARRFDRQQNYHGLALVIGRRDHKIEIVVTAPFQKVIPKSKQLEIRDAIVKRFRNQDFDGGVTTAMSLIEATLREAKQAGELPERTLQEVKDPLKASENSGLIVRNRVGLTLEGARQIVLGAEQKARELGLKVNVAVVDDGGHLLCFERMDGARPASGYTALTKAATAATFRQETGPLPKGSATPDVLLNLSLQNAAASSGGKVTTLLGGIPVLIDEQVIGAVGVGGGTGEQDAVISRAGVARFLDALKSKPEHKNETPTAKPNE